MGDDEYLPGEERLSHSALLKVTPSVSRGMRGIGG